MSKNSPEQAPTTWKFRLLVTGVSLATVLVLAFGQDVLDWWQRDTLETKAKEEIKKHIKSKEGMEKLVNSSEFQEQMQKAIKDSVKDMKLPVPGNEKAPEGDSETGKEDQEIVEKSPESSQPDSNGGTKIPTLSDAAKTAMKMYDNGPVIIDPKVMEAIKKLPKNDPSRD